MLKVTFSRLKLTFSSLKVTFSPGFSRKFNPKDQLSYYFFLEFYCIRLTIMILDTHTKITSDEFVHRLNTRGECIKTLKISKWKRNEFS